MAPAINITSQGLAFESLGQLVQLKVALQSGLWTIVSAEMNEDMWTTYEQDMWF